MQMIKCVQRLAVCSLWGLAGLWPSVASAGAAPAVEAVALMRNQAILRIDGHQQLLKVGESHDGVRLIGADPRQAILEIAGQRHRIALSQRIAGSFVEPERREVSINRDEKHRYRTRAELNGSSMVALVDTGANVVALNSGHAARIGIDYRRHGVPGRVETASGIRSSWTVKLDSIAVGGLTAQYVRAIVIEGDFPSDVLLGMSYLQHVDLRESNGIMVLSEK